MQFLGLFAKKGNQAKEQSFEELKAQLWRRVEYVVASLGGVSIKAVPLNTQELTELFYRLYNMRSTYAYSDLLFNLLYAFFSNIPDSSRNP